MLLTRWLNTVAVRILGRRTKTREEARRGSRCGTSLGHRSVPEALAAFSVSAEPLESRVLLVVQSFIFPDSWAKIIIDDGPGGLPPETVLLTGPSQVDVDWEGAIGQAQDDSPPTPREEVPIELVQLSLQGIGPNVGPVQVQLQLGPQSLGLLEEVNNGTSGQLDFPADSFFDVFFEVTVAGQSLHNNAPARVQKNNLTGLPPAIGDTWVFNGNVPLFAPGNVPTPFFITQICHTARPPLDFGDAPDSTYPTLLINDGARHVTITPARRLVPRAIRRRTANPTSLRLATTSPAGRTTKTASRF